MTHRPLRHGRALEGLHRRPGVVAVPACVFLGGKVCRGQSVVGCVGRSRSPHSIQSQEGRPPTRKTTGATPPSDKSIQSHPTPHYTPTLNSSIPTQPNPHTNTDHIHTYTHTLTHLSLPCWARSRGAAAAATPPRPPAPPPACPGQTGATTSLLSLCCGVWCWCVGIDWGRGLKQQQHHRSLC